MIPQEPPIPAGPRTGGLGPVPPRIRPPAANRSFADTAPFVQRNPTEPTQRRAHETAQGRAAPRDPEFPRPGQQAAFATRTTPRSERAAAPAKSKQPNSGGQKKQATNSGKAGSSQKARADKQKKASASKISWRWIIWGMLAVALLGIWLVKAPPWVQHPSPAGGTTGQTQTSPTGTLMTTTATLPVKRTATSTPAPTPQQVTARFLGAYFTWTGDDTDFTYADRWKAYVAPAYLAALEQSAPRLTIDSSNDLEGKSPIPTISATNVQITQTYAQVPINWTIQVLPPGGEKATWESRHIQATVALMQNGTAGWQITDVNWISTH